MMAAMCRNSSFCKETLQKPVILRKAQQILKKHLILSDKNFIIVKDFVFERT
jgi:hypothetical protein